MFKPLAVFVYQLTVCIPIAPAHRHRFAKFVIAAIWSGALASALPIPIVSQLQQPLGGWHEHCDRYICQEEWPSAALNFVYTMCLLCVQFVVPLAVLVFTYTRIAVAVWGKRVPGEAENSRDRRLEKSKRKVSERVLCLCCVI